MNDFVLMPYFYSRTVLPPGLSPADVHVVDINTLPIFSGSTPFKTQHATPAPDILHLASKMHVHEGAGIRKSRIFHGGFHLRRLIPIKDLLVPSGPGSGFLGSTFNLIKGTIGSGLLGLGLCTSYLGVGLSSMLILLISVFSTFSTWMMVTAGERVSASTYEVLMYKSFGVRGYRMATMHPFISCHIL